MKRNFIFLILLATVSFSSAWAPVNNACKRACLSLTPHGDSTALSLCTYRCMSNDCFFLIFGDLEVDSNFQIDEQQRDKVNEKVASFRTCWRTHPEWQRSLSDKNLKLEL